jgi:hypothetical protein
MYLRDPKSELSDDNLATLCSYLAKHLITQNISIFSITLVLMSFGTRYSLAAMFRFLEYGLSNKLDDQLIFSTLIHDLNGRHDSCFSPRTSSY